MADADDPSELSELAVHFLEEWDLIRFYGDDCRRFRQQSPVISPPRLAQRKSREIAAEKRREIAAEKRMNASTLHTPKITNSRIRS
ncbi:MAG TPA: hypothetical protein VG324_03275 [Blastocatellia bacterium]|nr:hypothetical protein [Blastocatellia bacterium]